MKVRSLSCCFHNLHPLRRLLLCDDGRYTCPCFSPNERLSIMFVHLGAKKTASLHRNNDSDWLCDSPVSCSVCQDTEHMETLPPGLWSTHLSKLRYSEHCVGWQLVPYSADVARAVVASPTDSERRFHWGARGLVFQDGQSASTLSGSNGWNLHKSQPESNLLGGNAKQGYYVFDCPYKVLMRSKGSIVACSEI